MDPQVSIFKTWNSQTPQPLSNSRTTRPHSNILDATPASDWRPPPSVYHTNTPPPTHVPATDSNLSRQSPTQPKIFPSGYPRACTTQGIDTGHTDPRRSSMPKLIFQLLLTVSANRNAPRGPRFRHRRLHRKMEAQPPPEASLTDQMKVQAVGPNIVQPHLLRRQRRDHRRRRLSGEPNLFTAPPCPWPSMPPTALEGRPQDKQPHQHHRPLKISPDGSTLTDTFTSYRPDGSISSLHYVYKRTAGASRISRPPGRASPSRSTPPSSSRSSPIRTMAFPSSILPVP